MPTPIPSVITQPVTAALALTGCQTAASISYTFPFGPVVLSADNRPLYPPYPSATASK